MGAMNRPEYESLEFDCLEKVTIDPETRAGAFKHNGLLGLDKESSPGGLEPRQAKAREPASTMANELLTQADSNTEAAAAMPDDHQLLDALMG